MQEPPRLMEDREIRMIRLERTCPHCQQDVIKDYDRETLRMLLGIMPLIDCPHCKQRF